MRLLAIFIALAFVGATATCQASDASKIDKSPVLFTTAADNVPIAYEVQGAGAISLVFIHGWCSHLGGLGLRQAVDPRRRFARGPLGIQRRERRLAEWGGDPIDRGNDKRAEGIAVMLQFKSEPVGGVLLNDDALHLIARAGRRDHRPLSDPPLRSPHAVRGFD